MLIVYSSFLSFIIRSDLQREYINSAMHTPLFRLNLRFSDRLRGYVWPTFLVWALDRSLRLGRAIYMKYWQSKAIQHDALVEILSEDSLRLTVCFPASKLVGWNPAQNAYVTIPCVSPLYPLEAHPFTIATIDTPVRTEQDPSKEEKVMKFIVRSRKGFTRRLYEYAERAGTEGECRVSVWIDGPYGPKAHVHGYPTVVLIAGKYLLKPMARNDYKDSQVDPA